jgi:putative RNA 2'-phosphotransferase
MKFEDESLSKQLSYVLRHAPSSVGLELNGEGWASIEHLIECLRRAGHGISREKLNHIVETSDKKRFTISDDGTRIRAAQGHSIPVALGLPPSTPPDVLYHGTATRFMESILCEGLKPRSRLQIHLSADTETAARVGKRHGQPAVLRIDSREMIKQGFKFYRADNGVWLTDMVPAEFIQVLPSTVTDSATTSRQPNPSI